MKFQHLLTGLNWINLYIACMNKPCKLSYTKGQVDLIQYLKKEADKIPMLDMPAEVEVQAFLDLIQNLKPLPKENMR